VVSKVPQNDFIAVEIPLTIVDPRGRVWKAPLAQVSTGKLFEVQKYCALSNHCWSGYLITADRCALQSKKSGADGSAKTGCLAPPVALR
jgi:hypothetical protein